MLSLRRDSPFLSLVPNQKRLAEVHLARNNRVRPDQLQAREERVVRRVRLLESVERPLGLVMMRGCAATS
jgi:hypothetical protein